MIQVRGINRTILEHKFNTKQNNTPACWYPATGVIHLFIKFLSTLLHQLQNPIRCMSIAGGHEFFSEGADLGGVEAGVEVLDVVDDFFGCFDDGAWGEFVVVVVEASPVKIFVQVVGEEDHRALEQGVLKNQ